MNEALSKRLRERANSVAVSEITADLLRDAADALSRAPAVQVPEGWKLVPVEMTDAMRPHLRCLTTDAGDVWGALLAAAPTPATVATEAVAQGGEVDDLVRAFNSADGKKLDSDARALLASAPAVPVAGVDVKKVMALVQEYGVEMKDLGMHTSEGYALGIMQDEVESARVLAEIRALLAAPAVPAGDGWMPIETAPKDGTEVLLLYKGFIVQAVWECVDSGDWELGQKPLYWWDSALVMMDDGDEPTHWMLRSALPPAPSVDREG